MYNKVTIKDMSRCLNEVERQTRFLRYLLLQLEDEGNNRKVTVKDEDNQNTV